MHKMGVERVQRYKVDQPIIAPAGFSWQTSLLKSHTMITYGASDFSEAEAAKFTALRSPLNLRLTQALRPNLSLVGGDRRKWYINREYGHHRRQHRP
jgi:hypothetical protein